MSVRRLRRREAGLAAGLLAFAAYGLLLGGFTHVLTWWWYLAWAAATLLATWLVSSYFTVEGGLDRGCSQCARMAALAIPVSFLLIRHATLAAAVVSLAVLVFGLTQRLNSPGRCAVPSSKE